MKNYQSGKYVNQGHYKSFQPNLINRAMTFDDPEVLQLLSQAGRELGKLDMFSNYVPNIDLFIRMHVSKEATQSSRIEGTRTNIDDANLDETDIPIEKREDWEEVQNYIRAMEWAVRELDVLPVSTRMIKKLHKILLAGVRGETKQPGEFRRSQNWVGGATIRDAVFIPPVHTTVNDLMGDLENFIHNENIFVPELLKIGLVHYQFETIHPFLDGNGRVGRLLIPLFLVSKGILQKPVLYLSDFFEKHRQLYYDNLMMVRENGNLSQWYKFFLTGITETCRKGIATFDSILILQREIDMQLQELGSRAKNAKTLIAYLYKKPYINAEKAGHVVGISNPSSYKLLKDLEELKILKEVTGGQRGRLYAFDRYIELFR
jgi:Fic family protein